MQTLSSSQTSPEVPINENFETLDHQSVYGKRHPVTTGLTWGYWGGRWGGFSIADGTLTLTNAATNYVVVLRSTGAISVSTSATNWNNSTLYVRVYQITTSGGAVTAVQDHRAGPGGVHGGSGGGSVATLSDVDLAGSPALDDGDVLAYDSASQRWRPRPQSSGGGGGGGSTQGKHAIPILAGAMLPTVTNGCAALAQLELAANQPEAITLDFDGTSIEYAQFSLPMPKKWNEGTITAKFIWSHPSTTTNFGVVWNIQAVAVSDDDPIAVAFGTAVSVTDTGGTTNDLYHSAETGAMTVSGTPQAEDVVFFRVYRDPTAGGDTMAVDARLHAVVLYITTAADTDA